MAKPGQDKRDAMKQPVDIVLLRLVCNDNIRVSSTDHSVTFAIHSLHNSDAVLMDITCSLKSVGEFPIEPVTRALENVSQGVQIILRGRGRNDEQPHELHDRINNLAVREFKESGVDGPGKPVNVDLRVRSLNWEDWTGVPDPKKA
jgi:hypothetical protein